MEGPVDKLIGFISNLLPGGSHVQSSIRKSTATNERERFDIKATNGGEVNNKKSSGVSSGDLSQKLYTKSRDASTSASAIRIAEEEAQRNRSYAQFLATCVGITVIGVAIGVRRQLKKEKFTFVYKEHKSSFVMAARALAYGTALCGVGAGVTVFAVQRYYGFRTLDEFAGLVRYKLDDFNNKSPDYIDEKRAIGSMNEKQEMDHWSRTIGIDSDDGEEDINENEFNSDEDATSRDRSGADSSDSSRDDMLDPPNP